MPDLFCFTRLDRHQINDRQLAAVGSALALNTQRVTGHCGADGTHYWALAEKPALARVWRPFETADGRKLLFAGHLLNRDELTAELAPGDRRSYSDGALYALARTHWGRAAENRLHGVYAAIIWDAAEQTLEMVRSPINAPPIHYTRQGRDIVAASVPRAIFATGIVDRQVDEAKVADSLILNYSEGERGWFANVHRVSLGERVVIGPMQTRRENLFDIADLPQVKLKDDREYVEATAHLLSEGVRRNMQGFSGPAVSLSGGFDSQSVAVMALDHLPENRMLDVYTSVPQAGWDGRTHKNRFGDERGHVKALCDMHPRLRSHLVDAAGLGFDHNQQAMFMLAEASPRNAMNLHWIHEIAAQAKRAGSDVLLTATFGNTTFSFDGTGYLPTLFRRLQWRTLFRELRAKPEADRILLRRLLTRAVFPNLPDRLQSRLHRSWLGQAFDGVPRFSGIHPDWAERHDVVDRAIAMGFDTDYRKPASTMAFRQLMLGGSANEGGDIMQGMELISGLPTRDPTAYRPLVEFCCGLPDDQYYRNGVSRYLARRMMAGRLPELVLAEERRGQQAADWMSRLAPQREELMRELDLLEQDEESAKRIDIAKLRDALNRWPDETPVGNSEMVHLLQLALPRALTTARFIRYVQGKN